MRLTRRGRVKNFDFAPGKVRLGRTRRPRRAYLREGKPPGSGAMEFRTRSLSQVLDDLVAKLKALPLTHPDRPTLTRMVIDLRREIERKTVAVPAPSDC
jgi:hypothetical protein